MNGMKLLKRMLCVLLCVVILSGTVGTKYFDSNHMEKVKAASIVIGAGITVATIAEICLFVGTVALSAYGIYEGYENREEIARFGKEFIDSCGDTVDGWVAQIVDASGQDYVFGSEALELVQDTEWSVIQGGLPPEGDPNKKDDKDKDKFHIPGDPMTHVAQFTALGATWFTTNAKNIYQDWCDILDGWKDKDTPIPLNNVLANNFPKSFTAADIEDQNSGIEHTYSWSVYLWGNYVTLDGNIRFHSSRYILESKASTRVAGVLDKFISEQSDGSTITYIHPNAYYFDSRYGGIIISRTGVCYNLDGSSFNVNNSSGIALSIRTPASPQYNVSGNLTMSAEFPIFETNLDMQNYLRTGNGYEKAINYDKDYRIADWLKQDWAGELIDPLVNIGLTLSQLIELMKQLGLKTMQGLTAQQLLELLKETLPELDPGLLPGATPAPAVDPALDPIYYPDPEAHSDRPPRPFIDSGPGADPGPGTDPDPGVTPLPDMDAADYKVELSGIFPFCIPFDFIALLRTLDAEPRAPCFTFPVVIPALSYREDVKLDLAVFDDVANVIRLCEKVSFILFLMFVTSKVIRW